MTPNASILALRKRFARFAADQDGVSAVEFAMLLPLMITLYLGGVEVSQAVSADRKTMLVAHSVGDLISQTSSVATADMSNIYNAANEVAYPFPSANLKVTATQVKVDANGNATVDWSCAYNGATARSGNLTSLIPAALLTANSYLIWSEASYNYTPAIGYVITGTLTLREQIYLRPRQSSSVALTGGCP